MPPQKPDAGQLWKPSHNPWLIAVSVMLATFMEVLDTSVANVALPHIAGSLAASTEQSTWVLTSYLISNAIVLPITGWLANRFGRKSLLLVCIMIFTISSALCGMATSLGFLIVARIIQGAGGGALQPISQAVLLESFPPAKRGQAMAVFAMGVVVAPILGPTLGGWITDNYSWRWIFYINIPIGALAVFMCQAFVQDPPYIQRARTSVDWYGFAFLALWLGTLQVVLDKGQEVDWFASGWILWFSIISGCSLIAFVIRELTTDHPIVDLCIFKNRNFAVGVSLMAVVGAVLYGTTAAIPLFLQTLLPFPALQAGIALSPRGMAAFVGSIIVGRLVGKVKNRVMIGFGFATLAVSSFMLGRINLDIGMAYIIWPSIINGIALSFIFVPLTTATMGHLEQHLIGNATGIFNLMRNLGGSFGISAVQTLIARRAQIHQALMVHNLTPYDPAFVQALQGAQAALSAHASPVDAQHQALGLINNMLQQQASLWAFVDNFRIFGFLCLACIPLVFLFKKVKAKPGAIPMH
ncbi:DHA2 family efflux MFS transporter permease subunit [Pedosphaera parvula]|uniref:Drug resistance transporter, EmrB/QacA subfamily n=1 Tax=Pedosphaera parvula (strain Ellin514) TaxID=320771 RepID=B9XRE5_PEDPL|nr:DHA2 family efflux MFS transporter permease subunit [Pedosphaera parvula]EEF57579.1 drug resistance transporter, EmrB/QacA subfamily [Pedosphaera parvula Ellin514]